MAWEESLFYIFTVPSLHLNVSLLILWRFLLTVLNTFCLLILHWILSIVLGIFDTHNISQMGSASIFRNCTVGFCNHCFVFNVTGSSWYQTWYVMNTSMLVNILKTQLKSWSLRELAHLLHSRMAGLLTKHTGNATDTGLGVMRVEHFLSTLNCKHTVVIPPVLGRHWLSLW
jgi:hypothetical protein